MFEVFDVGDIVIYDPDYVVDSPWKEEIGETYEVVALIPSFWVYVRPTNLNREITRYYNPPYGLHKSAFKLALPRRPKWSI